jgi:phosphatidate cytidylyltransferase
MTRRILTALVLIPPVLYVLLWAPLGVFLLVLLAVVGRNLYEYLGMVRRVGADNLLVAPYVGCGALCVAQCVALGERNFLILALLVWVLLATMFLALLRTKDLRQYMRMVSTTLLGILYVGFTLSCLIPLGFDRHIADSAILVLSAGVVSSGNMAVFADGMSPGRDLLVFLFLIIWCGDALAYFVGKGLGRTPLFPRVSPNKTVEGSLGGLLGSLLVGWVFARWRWPGTDGWRVVLLVGFVAAVGQIGDLAESALKRGSNLKDSGTLLPGHGGLLDRMDGLMFAIPALWSMLALLGARS